MSIRTQILLAVAGISLVTIGAFGTVVTRRIQARTHALAYQAAQENAAFIAVIADRGLEKTGASLDTAVKRLQEARWLVGAGAGAQGTRIQMFDATGALRFDSGTSADFRAAGPDVLAALREESVEGPVRLGDGLVAAAAPIRRGVLGDEILGAIRVIRPAVGVQEILQSIAPEIVVLAAVLAVMVLAAAFAAGRSISGPIVRLTAAARQVASGERSRPLPEPRGREVRELTDAYEDMRRELEDTRHIERMTQDLSHELKNPIASVRALAEALEDGGLEDPAAGPGLVKQIKLAASRLEGVLSDVLALAKLEARGLAPRESLELGRLVESGAEALAASCAERKVTIEVEIAPGPPAVAPGDPVWLARAVENLLANAVGNSGPGAQVTVRLAPAGGYCELTFS
ncbi:MAG: histidine kinase dimerization/phospho-acceptor domain-containing protein, partial [Myxococcaceae bacterium]